MTERSHVESAFEELGWAPREGQVDLCTEIVGAFAGGARHVFVDAPTGSGKSVVGIVSARAMAKVDPECDKSVVVSATNALVKQYERDFASLDRGVVPLFGAENYSCSLRTEMLKVPVTADRCYRKSRFFYDDGVSGSQEEVDHCGKCAFLRSREGKLTDPVVVTNYAYFTVDRLYLETLAEMGVPTFGVRNLFVFDEAHLINEQFSNQCAIFFSSQKADEFMVDVRHVFGDESRLEQAYAAAFRILFENVRRQTIGPRNVAKFLSTLMKFYGTMCNVFMDRARQSALESDYDFYTAIQDKYRRHLCKVEDYFKYGFEVAVTCDPIEESVSVKPIFVKGVYGALSSKYNLFLSATMDRSFMEQTLAIDPKTSACVRAPYRFKKDDKKVRIPSGLPKLNYQTTKDRDVLRQLGEMCTQALAQHQHESGIVVTTSFALASEVAARLVTNHNVIVHRPGTKVDKLVDELRAAKEPTTLVSPSLFEGIDLPGEASRFQVLVKAPYYSLADKRITAIMHNYPGAYDRMTVMRLVQGLGRSTRYRGDRSTSYFLDRNLQKLFDSDHNAWKDQFEVERGWVP